MIFRARSRVYVCVSVSRVRVCLPQRFVYLIETQFRVEAFLRNGVTRRG